MLLLVEFWSLSRRKFAAQEDALSDALSFFATVLTCLVTALHLYVFLRLASLPLIRRGNGRRALIIIGVLMWLIFLLGRMFHRQENGPLMTLFEVFF